ncbi:MAG: sugar ABC transporter permease [Treponema sp.]|jgi:raffinose/stachyose/melibiose transport system permease protein|nr:sugar ABC transporter permease [Treponema sp.]
MKSLFSNKKTIAVLVLPGLVIMLFAIAIPLVISLILSFVQWAGFGTMKFIGAGNYSRLLRDKTFWRSLYNVSLLIVVTIFFQNTFAFFIASLLTKLSERRSQLLRTIYFIPATLSLVVVTKLWVNIFHPTYGMLNKLIRFLGPQYFEIAWLGNTKTAIWAVIWIMIWQGFGWALLFFYGGLMTVPRELEEAALVDGANRLQVHLKVILPYMIPVIQSIIIIDVVSSLKQMEMVYLSTEGAPGGTTQFLAVYLYQRAFKYGEYGYGNAISVLFVLIAVLMTLLIQRVFRRSIEQF